MRRLPAPLTFGYGPPIGTAGLLPRDVVVLVRMSLSARDRRRCVPFAVYTVLAFGVLTAFGGGHGSASSWTSALVLVTAAVMSASTVHYVSDGDVLTWGLVEIAVGLAFAVPPERWGLVPLAGGILVGYGFKMWRQPVRAGLNAALYITGSSSGLAVARAVPVPGGLAGVGVGAAVASAVTGAVVFVLAIYALAHSDHRRVREMAGRYLKPDLMHAVVNAILAVALAVTARSDVKAAAAAVVVAALLLPQSTARLRAKAEAAQLRTALDGVADLVRATDPADAEQVLLRLARQLTGIGGLALAGADPAAAQRTMTPLAVTEASPMFVLGSGPTGTGHRQLHPSPERVLDRLAAVGGAALDASRRGQAWRDLAELDPLTGLLNRRAFIQGLDQHLAPQGGALPCAVVFIDLDGFKAVNDGHGHEAGDVLLRDIAAELLRSTRHGDVCARLGGDEFCMLLTGDAASATAESVSARTVDAVYRVAQEHAHPVSASIGIARFPEDGRTSHDLLQLADQRMYENKRARRTAAR